MFTLILPALLRSAAETVPPLSLPGFNRLLRFARTAPNRYDTCALHQYFLAAAPKLPAHSAYASPIWQQIGMHSMNLLSGAALAIRPDEAQQWCAELNRFYQGDAVFSVLRADLWRVDFAQAQHWHAPDIWAVGGQIDGTVRAEGEAQQYWLQLQTEIQMWLHNHEGNRVRQEQGLPPINGLWLWNAPEPADTFAPPLTGSDSPWAHTLPQHSDAPYDFAAWQNICAERQTDIQHSQLFLDDLLLSRQTADVWAYQSILHDWDARFFSPIADALTQRVLPAAQIITEQHTLRLQGEKPWQFWKRTPTFNGISL